MFYRISKEYNESYAFRATPKLTGFQKIHQNILPDMSGGESPGVTRCAACHNILNKSKQPLSSLMISRRDYDLSVTYDGIMIVSMRFIDTYVNHQLRGLEFEMLPKDKSFYSATAIRSVQFDTRRRGTKFENFCTHCNTYNAVLGATPVFLIEGTQISADEFVRSELEYGEGDAKSPVILCGEYAADILKKYKLRGFTVVDSES